MRINSTLPDDLVLEIDLEAKKLNISRANFIAIACTSYIETCRAVNMASLMKEANIESALQKLISQGLDKNQDK